MSFAHDQGQQRLQTIAFAGNRMAFGEDRLRQSRQYRVARHFHSEACAAFPCKLYRLSPMHLASEITGEIVGDLYRASRGRYCC